MRRVFALCLAVAAIASVHADDEQVASVSEDGVGATNITCLYDPCEVMTEYAVPPLGYAYDGLEPSIDNQTMTFHHDKHFAGYTKKMNAALAALQQADSSADLNLTPEVILSLVESYNDDDFEKNFRNNGGGYVNHKMYFATMNPDGQKEPSGALADAINSKFGSFDDFKSALTDSAMSVFGSGWAFLAYDPATGELEVITTANQDSPYLQGLLPLLGIDVWEHAYYLLRGPARADYVSAWWDVVDFKPVDAAYAKATGSAS